MSVGRFGRKVMMCRTTDSTKSRKCFGNMEWQADRNMEAYYAVAGNLQGRRYMECRCQHTRSIASSRICLACFVLCCRCGKNLWLVYRSQEAGTRPETVYPIRTCKGCHHLRYGTDACDAFNHTGRYFNHNERCRFRYTAANSITD